MRILCGEGLHGGPGIAEDMTHMRGSVENLSAPAAADNAAMNPVTVR
jgi:hypothetical protein